MKKKNIILLLGILLIIIPYLINAYSIFKLIAVILGIILVTIYVYLRKKSIFIIFLPLLLLVITYSLDYIKTYTFDLKPIYVLENKINNKVAIYNSLLYQIYKCDNKYILDKDFTNDYKCSPKLLNEINVNSFLASPKESFKEYHHKFIKVMGKISKVKGNTNLELKSYNTSDKTINGYVKFNENSKLIVNINNMDLSKYKIYDYVTVVGLLESFNKDNNELILTNGLIEKNNLYDNYKLEVILKDKCDNELSEYIPGYFRKCIENIYLNYGIDKYELSYAIKDGKITFKEILENKEYEEVEDKKIYKLDKFNILSCSEDKNIILDKDEKIDYTLCEK